LVSPTTKRVNRLLKSQIAGPIYPSVVPPSVVVVLPAGVSPAGSVVVVSVFVAGGVLVVVESAHPATTNAAHTSINANKLLIARSPENEMVSKTLAPVWGAHSIWSNIGAAPSG
jgi:hypothetical protein